MTRELSHIEPSECLPPGAAVLAMQGIPPHVKPDERTNGVAREAIALFKMLAKPRAVMMEIDRQGFDVLFDGEGHIDEDSPVKPIAQRSDHLALFALTIGEEISTQITRFFKEGEEGLASKLDMQEIYDLIGDEICKIFNAQREVISTYDSETETIERHYAIERSERVYVPGPHPVRSFHSQIVETRKPVLINTNVAEIAARLGQPTLPEPVTPKSWLGVPMIVGEKVTGILSLQNVEAENAFNEVDVHRLKIFAASMSLALENVRLFEEAQRLHKETKQRAAELQIINTAAKRRVPDAARGLGSGGVPVPAHAEGARLVVGRRPGVA